MTDATKADHGAEPMSNVKAAEVLRELLACCKSWELQVRILGNVRADDAAAALGSALVDHGTIKTLTDDRDRLRARVAELEAALEKERAAHAIDELELSRVERLSAVEAVNVLFPILGWSSGGLGAAAHKVAALLASRNRTIATLEAALRHAMTTNHPKSCVCTQCEEAKHALCGGASRALGDPGAGATNPLANVDVNDVRLVCDEILSGSDGETGSADIAAASRIMSVLDPAPPPAAACGHCGSTEHTSSGCLAYAPAICKTCGGKKFYCACTASGE